MNASFDSRLLNLVIFSPLVFAAVLALLPKNEKGQLRSVALAGMLVNFALTVWAFTRFTARGPEFQLEYRVNWVSEIGLSYHIGVDGLAIALVLLTGLLGPLVVLASWTFVDHRVKEFHLALLLLQTAMLGALCSLDTLLFYVFFEAMLIPMYLLIGVWGAEERQMAAMKFFLYTLVGSLLMLVALLAVYFIAQPAGARSFDYATIYNGLMQAHQQAAQCVQQGLAADACTTASPAALALLKYGPYMFLAFALAFAIKVPMFPFHTWLPDAHVQAPVAGSMVLAGVMLKMGTFGFWRFAVPLFPQAARQYQTAIGIIAVIGIVYGALMCLAQRDIKKLIAYSSVSHLGYCMLGIAAFTPEGATGSAYQMLNHGVSTSALFLLFGMLYERRHVRLMSDYGGIAKVMPVFATFFLIITFSSVAVPGTNGFVGEFLVLLGSFKSTLPLWVSALAATAVVLGAAYMLWMVQRVFFGPVTHNENKGLSDMNLREWVTALPLVVLVLVMGLMPQPLLDVIAPSTKHYIDRALFASSPEHQDVRRVQINVRELPPEMANAPLPQLDAAPLGAPLRNLRVPGPSIPFPRPLAPQLVAPAPVPAGH